MLRFRPEPRALPKPIYRNGHKYESRVRWFLRSHVPGIYREEMAELVRTALAGPGPVLFSRTRLEGQADVIIEVIPDPNIQYRYDLLRDQVIVGLPPPYLHRLRHLLWNQGLSIGH